MEHEITGNQFYSQLTFHINENRLSVLVDNGQVDVVDLADCIATNMEKRQTVSALTHSEE